MAQSRTTRQTETRRRLAEGQRPLRERLRGLLSWPLVIAVSFWACATLIVVSGGERLPYTSQMKLTQPAMSRVPFARVNEIRTAEHRKKAQQDVPNYFRLNQALVDGIQAEFRVLHAAVKSADNY